jgi:hypothetical protein
MRLLHLLLVITILNFSLSLRANEKGTQTIRGVVVDEVTGYPLIGANVILLDISPIKGTTTDLNGEFFIPEVPLGRQSLKISYLGYKPQYLSNVLVISGKELALDVKLTEDVNHVEEVVVKAKRDTHEPLNQMAMVSAGAFNIEQTERYAGSLGDPARMAANFAGVVSNNDSRNDIIIRGNSPSGVLWRLEGVEIPNPNHFGANGTTGGPVSMLNNNLLSNSDFFSGAFPAEYGNALSGAFDLNMRSGNNSKHEFTGQVGFNGFELGAEGPLFETGTGQKSSYLASFRYSTLEVMDKLGFDMGTGTAIPQYKDFTYMVDIPGTNLGRFKLFGLWGESFISFGRNLEDTVDNSYNGRGTATDFGSGLNVVGMSHTYFINEKTRVKTVVSYQDSYAITEYDSVKNRETIMPFVRSDQQEEKMTYTTQLRYKLNAKNNMNFGVIMDYFRVNFVDSIFRSNEQAFKIMTDIDEPINLIRGYAQWQHHVNDELSFYVGTHSQKLSLNNEITIEPRAGLTYQPVPQHKFGAGFGVHSQMQSKGLYFYQTQIPGTNTYVQSNRDLKFTRSNHYVLSHQYSMESGWRIKSEAYYQNLYNVPIKEGDPTASMLNAGGDFAQARADSLINEGTGENYGVEFTIEKPMRNGFYTLLTASLYNSTYKGSDGKVRNTTFNGKYVFNALAGYEYEISEKYMLTFDLKGTLAGGRPYIPIDLEKSRAYNNTEFNMDKAYEQRYDDYFRTDLRIGFKHNGKRFTQEWGLDLQNITNYKSLYLQSYDVDKGEIYEITQQGFMPMMLYRIQF